VIIPLHIEKARVSFLPQDSNDPAHGKRSVHCLSPVTARVFALKTERQARSRRTIQRFLIDLASNVLDVCELSRWRESGRVTSGQALRLAR